MPLLRSVSILGIRGNRLPIVGYDILHSERPAVSVIYAGVNILQIHNLPIFCLAFILPIYRLTTLFLSLSGGRIVSRTIYQSAEDVTIEKVICRLRKYELVYEDRHSRNEVINGVK
jgi:hypothetical protein